MINHAKFTLPLGIVAMMLFSGCTADQLPKSNIQSGFGVSDFGNYTWAKPAAYDGKGNEILDHPFLKDPASAPDVVYQLVPESGPEPSIGVTSKGNVFVITLDGVFKSTDHAKTWEKVYDYTSLNNPKSMDVYQSLDPMMFVDKANDRIFVTHLEPLNLPVVGIVPWCVYIAWSDDEGKTWSDKTPTAGPGKYVAGEESCLTGISDHQKLAVANFGPKASAAERALFDNYPNKYPRVLYYCHQKYDLIGDMEIPYAGRSTNQNPISGSFCETSYDAGRTYVHSTQIAELQPGCPAGLVGQPIGYPNGTVVIPLGSGFGCPHSPYVGVTQDNGLTWKVKKFPNASLGQTEIDPDITITPDGYAYLVFRDKAQHTYLLRSKDAFDTWEGPWRVSPLDQTLNVFSTIVSGDNGRIAISYLGSRDAQEKEATPSNATGGSFWHAFVTYSINAEATMPQFYTLQATPQEDPAQVGCVWLNGGGGGPKRCRNLLDFIDSYVDADGRLFSVITDGCTPRNGCTGDTDSANFQSHDRDAAVLVQQTGMSLFADKGLLASYGLKVPQPIPK